MPKPSKTLQSLDPNAPNVRSTTLPNGVVVLSERMEGQRSLSVGVWL